MLLFFLLVKAKSLREGLLSVGTYESSDYGMKSSLGGKSGCGNGNGKQRLCGSVNELDRALYGIGPSSSGSFKLSEFKKGSNPHRLFVLFHDNLKT